MSYTELIPFRNGLPEHGPEFRNAWGGAARIWQALFDTYLKNPRIEYDSWLSEKNQARLWKLCERQDLPIFERAVHVFTFDKFYVRRENFKQFAYHLQDFDTKYPAGERVNHLGGWRNYFLESDAEAVGLYGTSVGENLWNEYDEESDSMKKIPLTDGWEVYDALREYSTQTAQTGEPPHSSDSK